MKRAILSLLMSIALGVSVSAQCGAPGQCPAPATAVRVPLPKCGPMAFDIAFTGVPKLGSTTFSIDMVSPPAAAMFVLTKTSATELASPTLLSFSTEPPLKPNQPSHRISVPSVASGRLQP